MANNGKKQSSKTPPPVAPRQTEARPAANAAAPKREASKGTPSPAANAASPKAQKTQKAVPAKPQMRTSEANAKAPAHRPATTTAEAPQASSSSGKTETKRSGSSAHPTFEEISLRAYFISEHRQQQGKQGDCTLDWIEAERQLSAEQRKSR